MQDPKSWFKPRGYLHLTPRLFGQKDSEWLFDYVADPLKVANHAFFPLLHRKIYQRRYKKVGVDGNGRPERSHTKKEKGRIKRTRKERPIHYPTHLDAQIYAYYARVKMQEPYEAHLRAHPNLANCISAYRRIQTEDGSGHKNNIHFAKDVFDFIRQQDSCCAMAFDIENFFNSLNHRYLKAAWCRLLGKKSLPSDHYNIFKSVTNFTYVLCDEFRQGVGSRSHLPEREMAELRQKGIFAYFESGAAFREAVKSGAIHIHSNQYHNYKRGSKRSTRGIPQGLPISSMLANLYLLGFDEQVFEKVVCQYGGLYRRYSDDIVVVCQESDWQVLKNYVEERIREFHLEISSAKTEVCFFRQKHGRLYPYSYDALQGERPGVPFRYLGFEFYGEKTLIKSANIGKFYRRMKAMAKRKIRLVEKRSLKTLDDDLPIYKRKLYRLFTIMGKVSSPKRIPKWETETVRNPVSRKIYYRKRRKPYWRKYRGNTLTYAWRAARILNEPAIKRQFRKHWGILKQYIKSRMQRK